MFHMMRSLSYRIEMNHGSTKSMHYMKRLYLFGNQMIRAQF